jgi:hypothetical protein
MTVARPTVYIHELIASLRPDLPIRLIVGAPAYGYLERYRSNPFIEIIEVGADEGSVAKIASDLIQASRG